jgi:hypothetical protein
MSQKLFYRTACFIFGFGIGVVYFASPNSSHQRAEADSLTPEQHASSASTTSNSSSAVTPVETAAPEDIESLQQEEDHLVALEAELINQLKSGEGVVAAQPIQETADQQVPMVSESAAPMEQKQELETIAQELSETSDSQDSVAAAAVPAPAERPEARAQLKRLPQDAPASISRKMYVFEDEGASMIEKILDIPVTTALQSQQWEPIEFESEDVALSVLQHGFTNVDDSKAAREISHTNVVPSVAAVAVTPSFPHAVQDEAPGLASELTTLKQQNVDLKEQVLSLRVMMQAIQEQPTGTNTVTASKEIQAPAVLKAQKTQRPVPALRPITPTVHMNTDSEFESQPGDPVLVRYDRTPLRTGPGTNYSRVAVLPRGTQLTVDYHRQGWFRVYTADGVRAWISEDALQWF